MPWIEVAARASIEAHTQHSTHRTKGVGNNWTIHIGRRSVGRHSTFNTQSKTIKTSNEKQNEASWNELMVQRQVAESSALCHCWWRRRRRWWWWWCVCAHPCSIAMMISCYVYKSGASFVGRPTARWCKPSTSRNRNPKNKKCEIINLIAKYQATRPIKWFQ